MINIEDDNNPIYIKTEELGPHKRRVLVVPKNANPVRYTTWVWVLFAVFMSISATSFIIDSSTELLAKMGIIEAKAVATALQEYTEEKRLGSDDEDTGDVLVENASNGFYHFLRDDYKLPRTSALSYYVGDVDSGEMIISKNESMVLPTASVSKLTTALVAKDVLDMHTPITVSRSSVDTYGTMGGLYTGEKILVTDLFYPLLMESSNDAAEVLAEAYGRDNFLKKMNGKVEELAMMSTYFKDPSGLSPENVSTTKDLFTLAMHINKYHPELWDITRVREYSILSHKWTNTNSLSRKKSFIGGKNGYTEEATKTTLSVFDVSVEKQKRRLAIILLKSNDKNADTDLIIRFLESNIGFMDFKTDVEDAEVSTKVSTTSATSTKSK